MAGEWWVEAAKRQEAQGKATTKLPRSDICLGSAMNSKSCLGMRIESHAKAGVLSGKWDQMWQLQMGEGRCASPDFPCSLSLPMGTPPHLHHHSTLPHLGDPTLTVITDPWYSPAPFIWGTLRWTFLVSLVEILRGPVIENTKEQSHSLEVQATKYVQGTVKSGVQLN